MQYAVLLENIIILTLGSDDDKNDRKTLTCFLSLCYMLYSENLMYIVHLFFSTAIVSFRCEGSRTKNGSTIFLGYGLKIYEALN